MTYDPEWSGPTEGSRLTNINGKTGFAQMLKSTARSIRRQLPGDSDRPVAAPDESQGSAIGSLLD